MQVGYLLQIITGVYTLFDVSCLWVGERLVGDLLQEV
jgi:hypothetical protein